MVLPTNPYIAGAPLRGQSGFFGRQDVLEWVERELRNPNTNALVLFGQRRIGKTTLLLQMQRTLPKDAFLPVYFDLQDQARRSLGAVLADLADTIAERAGMSPPPAEAFDDGGRHFRTEFLVDLYAALDGRRLILLLDEFDVLDQTAERELPDSAATKALFPFLRRLMLEEPALAFVFVVGRRAEDLTLDFSATFKASLTREVWALDRESAVDLIQQAENSGTLSFSDEAIERVLQLSSGHPYLIQLLCQRMWEQAHEKSSGKVPLVDQAFVEAAVPNSLEAGYQAFAWLWDGLSPAEKIYTAAFAEATNEGETIAEDEVIYILATHAARLRTQEVEMAPHDLVRRRVLAEVDDHVYRFNIELFRRWIRAYKPLREVKDELDQIVPLADQTFEIGRSFYLRRSWDIAARYFRDALIANPRHLKARLFLGETLLQLGETDQAVLELQEAFALDRDEARLPLARALIANAKYELNEGDEDAALALLDRALELSPQEYEALEIKADIWNRRGDQALDEDDLETALAAYEKAGNGAKSGQVKALMQERVIASLESEARAYEGSAQWTEAAGCYEQLLVLNGDEERKVVWQRSLQRATDEAELSRLFADGQTYLEEEKWGQAQMVFADIVHRRPGYAKDGRTAIRLLEMAVKEGDSVPVWRRPFGWVIAFSGAFVLLLLLWAAFQAGGRYLPGLSAPLATATSSKSSAVVSDQPPADTATTSESTASQSEQAPAPTTAQTTKATPSPSPAAPTPMAESQDSNDATALLESFYEKREDGNIAEALSLINQAIESDPDHTYAYFERGDLYLNQLENLDAALSDLNRTIELEPAFAPAYDRRAQVYRSQGNNGAALDDWDKCLELEPDHHSCYGNRAFLYWDLGDTEAAYEDINRAIDISLSEPGYYALRGHLHRAAGKPNEAFSDYNKSLDLDPYNANVLQNRGEIYLHSFNEIEKALADFERSIDLDPSNIWAFFQRAILYARSGRVEEMLADYESAIAIAGDARTQSDVHVGMGRTYIEELDDAQSALISFNKAIDIDPNNSDAYQARGYYYWIHTNDLDTALEDMNRGIELDPSVAYFYDRRGQLFQAMGKFESAKEDFKRCLALQYNFCYFLLGKLYEDLEDKESAASQYWDYLTTLPEFECLECEEQAVDYIRNNAPGEVELFAGFFFGPSDMDFDQDRNLYVVNEAIGGDGSVLSKVSRSGQVSTVLTGLVGASGLAFNSKGILHVSDNSDKIYQVADDGSLSIFIDSTAGLDNPNAIAFDANDNLYVLTCGGGNLAVFDPEGELINFELAVGFECPQAIVVDDNGGVLYISDIEGNIYQIDMMSGDLSPIIIETDTKTEGGLVLDNLGNLYYAQVSDDQVYRINHAKRSVEICLNGLAEPRGLAFDSRGILYISAPQSGRIYRAIGCQPQT